MTFRAVIMAGGRGARLGTAAAGLPKALLPLGSGHVLGRLLDQMAAAGCSGFDLCLGFQADDIMASIGHSWHDLPVRHWREDSPLGTAGALRRLLRTDPGPWPDDLLVANCDIVADLDLADLLDRHRRHGQGASVVTAPLVQSLRFGIVETAGDGQPVTALREKPQVVHRIIAGLYIFRTASLIQSLGLGEGRLDMPDLLAGFLGPGAAGIVNLDLAGNWIDVGLPEDYARACERFG